MKEATLVDRALMFAAVSHQGQVRKYTNEPYICHPAEVISILASFSITNEHLLAGAALHDTVEDDPDTSREDIVQFGGRVYRIVDQLTEVEWNGNRAARKRLEAERLWAIDPDSQTVKYADLISNSKSILTYDHVFAKIYLPEKKMILTGMDKGHQGLYQKAWEIVDAGMRELNLS